LELRPHRQCDDCQNRPNDLPAKWIFMPGDLHAGRADGELVMNRDPIVEEVRAIREQLAARFDFDIGAIVADAQKRQVMSKRRIVSFQRTPPHGLQAPVNDLASVVEPVRRPS
jgi:hypothetical protein